MKELSSEHQSLLKKFKRCVDTKSIEKMDKKLYHFFMCQCGFIAHYSLQGFRGTYEGNDFLIWFNNFANANWLFNIHNDEYQLLKDSCVQYSKEQAINVSAYFETKEKNRKINLYHALAAELAKENEIPQLSIME